MKLHKLTRILATGCMAILMFTGIVTPVKAAVDDLPIHGFYEYDFKTQKQSAFSITIPDDGVSELVMDCNTGTAKKATPKSRWVKKNGSYYYYNSKGKLLKDGIYKIKGSYYRFDRSGKRTSASYKSDVGFYFHFDKKTGKLTNHYTYLILEKVDAAHNIFYGYTWNVSHPYHYCLSSLNARVLDIKGRKVPLSYLKKGDKVRVYTDSMTIFESGQATFRPVRAVKLVKRAK